MGFVTKLKQYLKEVINYPKLAKIASFGL